VRAAEGEGMGLFIEARTGQEAHYLHCGGVVWCGVLLKACAGASG
jgi:hypothetical protein